MTQSAHHIRSSTREAILHALYRFEYVPEPANIEQDLRQEVSPEDLDRPYFESVFRGVIAHLDEINACLEVHADRPLSAMNHIELLVMR